MRAYQTIKKLGSEDTRERRRFRLPWFILFGEGLNGDRSNVASRAKTLAEEDFDERKR